MTMGTACEQNYMGMSCEHKHHGNGKTKHGNLFCNIKSSSLEDDIA
jgi:hypothetical protein